MKKILNILLFCISSIPVIAQTTALKTGDKMPNISLGKMINHQQTSLQYAETAGRAVILDFWATHCSPCIKELIILDSIQKHFGNKIMVIPVTAESDRKGEVSRFFSKNSSLQLPSIIGDTVLKKLFPHEIIPHIVWIGSDGIVKSITSGAEITKENITAFLHGSMPLVKQKRDIQYDAEKPLFINDNGGSGENFLYRSILTGNIDGMSSFHYAPKEDGNRIRNFTASNSNLYSLFYFAFSMCRNIAPINVMNVFIDSANTYTQLSDESYTKSINSEKNYCYTLNLPYPVSDSLFFRKYYLDELNKNFDLTGRIEKRKMQVLTIVRTGDKTSELLLSKHQSKPRVIYERGHGIIKTVSNKSFNYVLELLRTFPGTPPIINNTGFSNELVEMDLDLNWQLDDAWNKPLDIPTLRKSLNRYGLDIVDTPDGIAEVLVISKKTNIQ